MIDDGREVHPDDLPPELEWEQAVWDVFTRVRTQWRVGPLGPTALDYNPAIVLLQARELDLDLGLDLLSRIEVELLSDLK